MKKEFEYANKRPLVYSKDTIKLATRLNKEYSKIAKSKIGVVDINKRLKIESELIDRVLVDLGLNFIWPLKKPK